MGRAHVPGLAGGALIDPSSGSRNSRRTRVLFTIPNLEGGGAERVQATLLRHLDRSRFEPHLALVERRGPYLADLPHDVPVHDLAGRGPLAFLRLLRLVRRLRPDVVFSSLTFYSTLVLLGVAPLAPPGTRFVARENSLPSVHLPGMPYGWLRRLLYPFAHRRAHRVICQTAAMAEDVARCGVPAGRLTVVPNPLDIAAVTARAAEGDPYARPGRHVVAAGRLIPLKGFDLLLDAFAPVARARPGVTLHLLGEGPERTNLERRAARLGLGERVVLEGFRANPYPWFRHADLFVLSSRYEGFANVALEALALGTPVIAFDCPGAGAVADGINGWRVPMADVNALTARLGAALDAPPLPRERVAASVADHDVKRVMAAFEAVLAGEG